MLSSQISAPTSRPLSSLSEVHYREVDKAVVDAKGRVQSVPFQAPLRNDRSMYEFPGDRTYSNYLSRGA